MCRRNSEGSQQAEFPTCFFWNEKSSNLFVSNCSQVGNGRTNKSTKSRKFSAIVKSSGMFHIFSVKYASSLAYDLAIGKAGY